MKYSYTPEGVCSRQIAFELDGNKVKNIEFSGGCNGNLKAVSKLLEGQTVEYIEEKLRGNTCGIKSTSCADQLAIAIRKAYDSENKN
ncbi:MAG: TIGR03905 family TSCPD domain-containing protein [Clostridia bacterium]|nr:TIGR03905 family TSCPD domain-containing protein [Clostridia bacterium]